MDWTLIGALGGVAILAITAGYEISVIARSNPEPAKEYRPTPVLIPTLERPVVNANANTPAVGYTLQSNAPAVAYAPASQANPPPVSDTAESSQYPSRVEIPPPIGSRPKDHSPPPDYPISGDKEAKQPPPQPKPQISSEFWEVRTTANASYFNLGGHVDKNGVVDSLASSYLRDALMKHKNYAKLPPQIQMYIGGPNINLAKIAGYRALLGMDDKEMEEKQGVKFIRIAGSRSIAMTSPGAAVLDASPIDLGSLERMDFDLRLRMTLGFVP
jgi:hypothetical protein